MEQCPSYASTAASTEDGEVNISNNSRVHRRRGKSPPRRSKFRSTEGVAIGTPLAKSSTCDALQPLTLDTVPNEALSGDASPLEHEDSLDAAVNSARTYWDKSSSALDAVEVSLPMLPK
mmetsp:Transcript_120138/g.234045  ORF Transcript_120138/g.234045 Transcript_120138/m.234045 type:complete len:119 (-) Transcript_120138:203-559(-)